jgi:hypothetical protein
VRKDGPRVDSVITTVRMLKNGCCRSCMCSVGDASRNESEDGDVMGRSWERPFLPRSVVVLTGFLPLDSLATVLYR